MLPKMRCLEGCTEPIYGLKDALFHTERFGHECEPVDDVTSEVEATVGRVQLVLETGRVIELGTATLPVEVRAGEGRFSIDWRKLKFEWLD